MATGLTPDEQRNQALLDKALDQVTEFTPFLAKETIKLTPRRVMDFLCRPTKTGKVCTYEQALRFVMLCKARGLNPWEGDAYIVGYDSKDGPEFNLITAHQAFLKRAEVHPEYDGMESGVLVKTKDGPLTEVAGDFVDDGQQVLGGWARIHFKGRSHPMYKRLKLATFNKGFSRWAVDPAGMIVKCAEADALRSAFPNSLGGMYLDDELAPSPNAVSPAKPEPLPAGRLDLRDPVKPEIPADTYPGDDAYQTQAPPEELHPDVVEAAKVEAAERGDADES